MQILTLAWNNGSTLYPCKVTGGVVGVRSSSLHVFGDLEKAYDHVLQLRS